MSLHRCIIKEISGLRAELEVLYSVFPLSALGLIFAPSPENTTCFPGQILVLTNSNTISIPYLLKAASIISQANSWSRLKVSIDMFCMLAQYCSSSLAFIDLALELGFKTSDTEENCGILYYRLHSSDEGCQIESYGKFYLSSAQLFNPIQKSRTAYGILNSMIETNS